MPIINELIEFFGLDLIASSQTFPELLSNGIYAFLAACIVVYVIRALSGMNSQISWHMSH